MTAPRTTDPVSRQTSAVELLRAGIEKKATVAPGTLDGLSEAQLKLVDEGLTRNAKGIQEWDVKEMKRDSSMIKVSLFIGTPKLRLSSNPSMDEELIIKTIVPGSNAFDEDYPLHMNDSYPEPRAGR